MWSTSLLKVNTVEIVLDFFPWDWQVIARILSHDWQVIVRILSHDSVRALNTTSKLLSYNCHSSNLSFFVESHWINIYCYSSLFHKPSTISGHPLRSPELKVTNKVGIPIWQIIAKRTCKQCFQYCGLPHNDCMWVNARFDLCWLLEHSLSKRSSEYVENNYVEIQHRRRSLRYFPLDWLVIVRISSCDSVWNTTFKFFFT